MEQIYKKILFVLYDSVKNSVFQSQVMAKINQLLLDETVHIDIISFEPLGTKTPDKKSIPSHPRLQFFFHTRLPFWGESSLWFATKTIKEYFQKNYTEIYARGVLASLLILKNLERHPLSCNPKSIILQARGLSAAEYSMIYLEPFSWTINAIIRKIIYFSLDACERSAYYLATKLSNKFPIQIEVVSQALIEHLVAKYGVPSSICFLAQQDIPPTISFKTRFIYRTKIRTWLQIPDEAKVYCYSGSVKAWQCLHETIIFFIQQRQSGKDAYLLLLTTEVKQCRSLLLSHAIELDRVRICAIPHDQVVAYLCAADFGIVFRKNHIVNWTSRPTKALEYRAAGLTIIHNQTVDWLLKQEASDFNAKHSLLNQKENLEH